MIEEIQRMLDQYVAWLRDKTTLREVSADWVEITTPYLDRHNDYLQIYVKKQDGGFLLSDDGYIIQDLMLSGCVLESTKRQALLKMTLNGFGVHMNKNALEINASPESFALRKHNLLQAMLAVNDLFYLAVPMVASLFYEDVVDWLDSNEIRYTPNVKFTGKSGFDYLFEFVIPKSRVQPERILHTINRPSREAAKSMILSWTDTKEVRPPDSRAFALLNDLTRPVSPSVIDALRNYDVTPVPWTTRDSIKSVLVA